MVPPFITIKLWHSITYKNSEAVDNTKKSFRTTLPCYSIELKTDDFETDINFETDENISYRID